jgi:hypothetical protein
MTQRTQNDYECGDDNALARYLSEKDDYGVSFALDSLRDLNLTWWLNRHAAIEHSWCWVLFGKEVRRLCYPPEPGFLKPGHLRPVWKVEDTTFNFDFELAEYLITWVMVEAIEAGIVVEAGS